MPCVCCKPTEDVPLQTFDDLRHWTDVALLASLFSSDEVARAFHEQFPRLDAIVSAAPTVLARVPGVGRRLAERLLVAFELGARARAPAKDLREIRAPCDVYDTVSERFRGLKQELFLVLLLDTKNRLMRVETVALGTLNASLVHPREIFRPAIQVAAAAVALTHNHPSGVPDPSAEDVELTKRIAEAGRIIGIEVLDHVVVGDGKYISLRERGAF